MIYQWLFALKSVTVSWSNFQILAPWAWISDHSLPRLNFVLVKSASFILLLIELSHPHQSVNLFCMVILFLRESSCRKWTYKFCDWAFQSFVDPSHSLITNGNMLYSLVVFLLLLMVDVIKLTMYDFVNCLSALSLYQVFLLL